jgi:alginate O-acetyltransferase complex protein AlgJ
MNHRRPIASFFWMKNLIFFFIFIFLLFLPAWIKLPPPSDFQTNPGKFLTSHPVLQEYWTFTQLPENYLNYFSTHFFLRDQAVTWNNEIISRMGNKVFHDVLVGSQGWLFLTDENNLSYYQCDQPFTEEELSRIVEKVKSMQNFSAQNGADFLLLIAPNKESIYPEFMPPEVVVSGKPCRMDQTINALHSAGLDVRDLRKPLRDGKTTKQLYFRTDTHWNDDGAFLIYQGVIPNLKKRFPSLDIWSESDFEMGDEVVTGDLSHLIPLEKPFSENSVVFTPLRPREAQIRQGDDSKTIISETGNQKNPNTVVFRDSFFMGLLPFFAESFNRAIYRWAFDFDQDLIATEKPDLVIYELAERYLSILAR